MKYLRERTKPTHYPTKLLSLIACEKAYVGACILLNGKTLEEVTSAKLLGLNISSDLKWNVHVLELVKSCRLYFLRQLKRSQVMPEELMLFTSHAFVPSSNMHVPCSIVPFRATSARTWRDCKNVHCELFTPVCHTIRP